MPLKPTRLPADEERFEVRFLMRDGAAEVECFVDEAAIEDVDDGDEDPLVERFGRHRAAFEAIASWLYDEGEIPRVELHHLAQFRER
jgi:hypothetical protein